MSLSFISVKGQVTLPAKLRRKLGLKPGDRVSIESTDKAIVVQRVPDISEFEGVLGKALPLDEERRRMMQAVADHVLKGGPS